MGIIHRCFILLKITTVHNLCIHVHQVHSIHPTKTRIYRGHFRLFLTATSSCVEKIPGQNPLSELDSAQSAQGEMIQNLIQCVKIQRYLVDLTGI